MHLCFLLNVTDAYMFSALPYIFFLEGIYLPDLTLKCLAWET